MTTNYVRKHYENALEEERESIMKKADMAHQESGRWQDLVEKELSHGHGKSDTNAA